MNTYNRLNREWASCIEEWMAAKDSDGQARLRQIKDKINNTLERVVQKKKQLEESGGWNEELMARV